MTRLFCFLFLLIVISTCTTTQKRVVKVEQNFHCEECDYYINQILIPQIKSCKFDMNSYEDCKFDRDLFAKNASCLLGMKKHVLERTIGTNYYYSVKNYGDGISLFGLIYSINNTRLIEIFNVDIASQRHSNIPCLDCDDIYEKIRNGERLKKMSFEEFHERYKGCFYGKLTQQLIPSLDLTDRIEEPDHYYSYNKTVQLGKSAKKINFLFYAGERVVDIRLVN